MSFYGLISNTVRKLSDMFSTQSNLSSSRSYTNWNVQHITKLIRGYNNYAVVVLNRPLTQNIDFLIPFWNNAHVRVTVDGGTKQWDLFLNSLSKENLDIMKLPDLVTGDFDSIPEEIFEKYRQKGCEIVHTPDQNLTDFTKALMELKIYCLKHKWDPEHIIAIGQSSGRIDHILGNIQTLFLVKEKQLLNPKMKLYLMSDDAVSWLLGPGEHIINIPEEARNQKRVWCSLVPVGQVCESVTTKGLKWNLNAQPLGFGELVSTSNSYEGAESVVINCSHPLLWSMRIQSLQGHES